MELRLRAIRGHLPSHRITRQKWPHPTLTPARHNGTRFTYPAGMEGWVQSLSGIFNGGAYLLCRRSALLKFL